MDVFGQTVSAGRLIIEFLTACSAFSGDAKSLTARFEWDLRVIGKIQEYFNTRRAKDADHRLSLDDQRLLERTSKYLDNLSVKVQQSLHKIERKGFLSTTINKALWITRKSELLELEREVYNWTDRFGVRVLGLPKEFKHVLPTGQGERRDVQVPAVVKSNSKLQGFLALATDAKNRQAKAMLLKDPGDILSKITSIGDVSSLPLEHNKEQLIFSSRTVPANVRPGTQAFENLESDLGELSAALSCLDPSTTDIRLLRVEYYFYDPNNAQFLFAHRSPMEIFSMMTLEELIKNESFSSAITPLNRCFEMAYKLAEAVFFLHTAGFLHKNITSSSIAILRSIRINSSGTSSHDADDKAYLMGFNLIRSIEAITYKQGVRYDSLKDSQPNEDVELFQHPDRLQGMNSPRYVKAYDIYSLGVVLFQIGLWRPLSQIGRHLAAFSPPTWADELVKISPDMVGRVGERYQRLVEWCLRSTKEQAITDADFVQCVLDPLEEMRNALS
ncbi:hypothetical protein ACHAPV_000358 [Trichoderma viride]